MSVAVIVSGLFFNLMNGYLNGWYLFVLSGGYPTAWLTDLRFITGVVLFLAGFIINRQADAILLSLRRNSDTDGYRIPYGGLFRWVSCPNYFGEILIWSGWAVATWSLPGLTFAVWTLANLAPRARSHHRWYKRRFSEYPRQRKALIPGIW
jgi:steroid 5-alpha reductase family enzyme